MVSRDTGWALASTPRGSVLLRTAGGGTNWQNVSPQGIWPLSSAQIASNENFAIGFEGIDCYGLSGQVCWVAMISELDQIIVERTHDGGRHWAKSEFTDHTGLYPLVSFLDRRRGWILTISDMASGSTRKELFETKDGGRTWATVTKKIPDHIDPHGLTFRSASVGWLAAGYHGSDQVPFYRTGDGGRHWNVQELDTAKIFKGEDGYGIVHSPSYFGPKHRDGLLPVQFRGIASPAGLYRTRDGGDTWRLTASLPMFGPIFGRADTIQFLSLKNGWLMENVGEPMSRLLRTQDGGRHWRVVYPKQRKQ